MTNQYEIISAWNQQSHLHVSFVIVPNLLDADIVLGINEGLRCGVGLGQCHNAGNVLKIILIVHFDLWKERPKYNKICTHWLPKHWSKGTAVWPCTTFPIPEWACPIFTTTGNRGEEIYNNKNIILYYFRILNDNDQRHHFLMHLHQTEWPVAAFSLLPLQEILIHIDGLKAGKVLPACRVWMGGWRWLLWTNSYWRWLGTLITQNEKKKKNPPLPGKKTTTRHSSRKLDWTQLLQEIEYWHESELAWLKCDLRVSL